MSSVEWLEEACGVYSQIEETRKWLLKIVDQRRKKEDYKNMNNCEKIWNIVNCLVDCNVLQLT